MKKTKLAVVMTASLVLMGCQSTSTANTQRLDSQVVDINVKTVSMQRGVLLTADPVQVTQAQMMERNKTGNAAIAGGALLAGASHNRGAQQAGAAIAAVGLIAKMAENADRNRLLDAFRYTVQSMETNELFEVIQIDPVALQEGAPVLVRYMSDGNVQVRLDTTQGRTFESASDTQFNSDPNKPMTKAERIRIQEQQAWEDQQRNREITNERKEMAHEQTQYEQEQLQRRQEATTSVYEKESDNYEAYQDARNDSIRNSDNKNINIKVN